MPSTPHIYAVAPPAASAIAPRAFTFRPERDDSAAFAAGAAPRPDLPAELALASISVVHARGDARRAASLVCQLRETGLVVGDPEPSRADAPGVYYVHAHDRGLADRIAALAGIAAPPALSAAPFGAATLAPGSIRIVVGPDAGGGSCGEPRRPV